MWKRLRSPLCSVLVTLALGAGPMAVLASAQIARVQQDPQVLTACQSLNATGAVNATATLTITPPSGQYVYLCGLDITISFDATGGTASTNVSFTSTNLNGWAWKTSWAGTVSTTIFQPYVWTHPVKSSQAGVAVTVVSPAANLHGAYSINGYYYFAN